MTNSSFWANQRVLVTGHSGFKGSWLSTWLLKLGAEVHGISLPPESDPSLFAALGLGARTNSNFLDIRDAAPLRKLIADIAPTIVFHLAAQSLVRPSYHYPLDTWSTNLMGTANILDAVTQSKLPCTVVAVTTDKVYQNNEWVHAYRETDQLGGHDPYSASKAACELLLDSWRKSFFQSDDIRLTVARAGNVIGGGDWATDRLVPDIVRAIQAQKTIEVRNPTATRPWQHVLDPLAGYLMLAEKTAQSTEKIWQEPFNFGPDSLSERTVEDLLNESMKHWQGSWRKIEDSQQLHEAGRLALSTDKVRNFLGWRPRWSFEQSVEETINWYRSFAEGEDAWDKCIAQIDKYENAL